MSNVVSIGHVVTFLGVVCWLSSSNPILMAGRSAFLQLLTGPKSCCLIIMICTVVVNMKHDCRKQIVGVHVNRGMKSYGLLMC